MCGIAGIVGTAEDTRLDSAVIHEMCQAMIHRGPDAEGIFVKNGVGFGMRRLSIIDLVAGSQPVFNEDRSAWVVFNGEIYNFREIRHDLESRGHRFRSNSDTEVIVHLYEDFGSGCVDKLRGMFAFAIFDEHNQRLLLARDRLGIKPLHYALSQGRLLFGSEIKSILAVAPELSSINQQAILQYFYFGYIPDPDSAFQQIKKLPPGHLLEYDGRGVQIRRYWDLPQYGTYSPRSEEQCLDELEEKLSEAVCLRLMADVPIGAFLSGGTDSSTVVALMARHSSRPVKTFSIGFRDKECDESAHARKVSKTLNTEHHELIAKPNIVEVLEKLAASLEEPFGDSSILPTYLVSDLARQYVTVALSGDGGDETFAGYDRYSIHLRDRARFVIPEWIGRSYREQLYPKLPRTLPGRNVAYSMSLPWSERYVEAVSFVLYQRSFGVLSKDFVTEFGPQSSPHEEFRKYLDCAPAKDPLSRVLYLDTKTYLPGDVLTKVDRMSMAVSLEVRVPLLDHVLLEWITSLTPEWKMGKRGPKKYILTRLAERLGVPHEVLYRPKQGFALPLTRWMRNELKELVISLLLDESALQRGYFDEKGVGALLDAFFAGRTDDYLPIWRLMMFELWQRSFLPRQTRSPQSVEDVSMAIGTRTA